MNISINNSSREEVYASICTLSKSENFDVEYMRKLLAHFTPWDEEHSFESLFAQAYAGGNVELYKLLYEYCPHPDYKSEYMYYDVFFDTQYLDNYPGNKPLERLNDEEQKIAIAYGDKKIEMLHILLTHPDAVEAYKKRIGSDEILIHYIAFKMRWKPEEETPLSMLQLKRVFIELTAFHVYTDEGPTIMKAFDLDRLMEYRMTLHGKNGKWQIFDYTGEMVAEL